MISRRVKLVASIILIGVISGTLAQSSVVSLGIDELEKSNFSILEGKRVGLVTNPSGADSSGRSAIRVLYAGQSTGNYKLLKLFGPEHGIDGQAKAGRYVRNSRDPATGLPVYSLYADTRHPTPEMLAGLDVVVYDVQDLGNRSYTFISTLGYVMDECSRDNVEVIVLDRPNPLGGNRIEGPRLDPSAKSFVGLYNIPVVYGLTPGELAEWINSNYLSKPCKLTVIKMRGWSRDMVWEDTGLRWVPTSPNIPSIGAARGYTATGFLGEIGLENGIGGPKPFEVLSGQNFNSSAICQRFNAYHVPGVVAVPYEYASEQGGDAGTRYSGAYLRIDPHYSGNLTAISLYAIDIYKAVLEHFSPFGHTTADERSMFDKVTGIPAIRSEIIEGTRAESIVRSWISGCNRWQQERRPYLLYGNTAAEPTVATTVLTTPPVAAPSAGAPTAANPATGTAVQHAPKTKPKLKPAITLTNVE